MSDLAAYLAGLRAQAMNTDPLTGEPYRKRQEAQEGLCELGPALELVVEKALARRVAETAYAEALDSEAEDSAYREALTAAHLACNDADNALDAALDALDAERQEVERGNV